jgi:uncharacterized protein (DUF924 family)
MHSHEEILSFWFEECTPNDWFGGGAEFDARLKERFAETHARVALGEAWTWRRTAEGRLAEIIVLDQFSRQIHRGTPEAFAHDDMALTLAQEAVAFGYDKELDPQKRMFLYMPYMHSESLLVHESAALPLFESLGNPEWLQYEVAHLDLIRRFGRFPKRNAVLGRQSTPEELTYIVEAGDRDF